MTNYIWITTQKEMIHKYPDAPDDVAFLKNEHRHLFKFKVWLEVFHNDRDVEFIMFKRDIQLFIDTLNDNLQEKSCEMISNTIAKNVQEYYAGRDIKIEVSEDGENGSEYYYSKAQSLNTDQLLKIVWGQEMSTITNNELNELTKEKHDLARRAERKEMSEEEYEKRYKELETRINEKVKMLLDSEYKKNKVEEINMAENEKVEPKVEDKKIGRKANPDSYGSIIAKVLAMKTIKTVDAAVDKVDELKPGRDKAKIKNQVKVIIRLVKQQKARWANYTWDEAGFQLNEK